MKSGSQHDNYFELPCEEILKLYNEGLGVLSIAVRVRVPAAKVRKYLSESSRIYRHALRGKSEKCITRAVNVSKERARAAIKQGIREKYYEPHDGKGLPDYMI